MKNTVVILGGGNDQVPLIKELNARGYFTVIVDYYDDPPGKSLASKHYIKSSHDFRSVLKVVQQENPLFLASSGNDPVVPVMAQISETMDLRTPVTFESAILATDKNLMKRRFTQFDIPTASCFTLEAARENKSVNFPIVVKPVKGTSSKGVCKIKGKKELDTYCSRLEKDTSNIIAEEFIEGSEISVDCIVEKGSCHILNTTDLIQVPNMKEGFSFLYTECPSKVSEMVNRNIAEIANKIARAFGISFGPFFFQAKVKGEEIFVIEMGARIAGGNKAEFIRSTTGFDILEAYVDQLEGKDIEVPTLPPQHFFSKFHVYASKGILEKVVEPSSSQVVKVERHKKRGEMIGMGVAAKDRVLSVTVQSRSKEALKEIRAAAITSTHIYNDRNDDLVLRDLYI